MKKIFILAAIIISTNCLSQTLNDTIPYLQSKIVTNISLYKDKPLSTLLDKFPYQIKGYRLISSHVNDENVKIGGVVLFISSTKNALSTALSSTSGNGQNLNYSPKSIIIYFKDNSSTNFFDPIFKNSLDGNNWNNFIEKEFRKPKYIVERIVIK